MANWSNQTKTLIIVVAVALLGIFGVLYSSHHHQNAKAALVDKLVAQREKMDDSAKTLLASLNACQADYDALVAALGDSSAGQLTDEQVKALQPYCDKLRNDVRQAHAAYADLKTQYGIAKQTLDQINQDRAAFHDYNDKVSLAEARIDKIGAALQPVGSGLDQLDQVVGLVDGILKTGATKP